MNHACAGTFRQFASIATNIGSSGSNGLISRRCLTFIRDAHLISTGARSSERTFCVAHGRPAPRHEYSLHIRPISQRKASFSQSRLYASSQTRRKSNPRRQESEPGSAEPPVFPFGTLSPAKLADVFGQAIGSREGNYILRILHQRRVNGSLVDHGLRIDKINMSEEAKIHALTWLRKRFPLDEAAAAEIWAEREIARLERSYMPRSERREAEKKRAEEGSVNTTSSLSGRSVIEEMQAYHRERRKREAEEKKSSGQEQKEQELRVARQVASEQEKAQRAVALAKRRETWRKQATVSDRKEPPKMSMITRISPSLILGVIMMLSFSLYGNIYQPPDTRIFPDIPVSVATIGAIVALNSLVCFLWFVPAVQRFLNMYFIVVPAMPFAPSMLGNVFSHQTFKHLLGNMTTLTVFGIWLHEMVGRGQFLEIYLSGGVAGSLGSLAWFTGRNKLTTSTLGASGAIWAVLLAWAYLTLSQPQKPTDSPEFAKDVAGFAAITMLISAHFVRGIMGRVDVVSHMVGGFMGLVIAHQIQERRKARKADVET